MRQHTNTPGYNLSKHKKSQDQPRKVFSVLTSRMSKILMESIETEIQRANLFRYVAASKKEQSLLVEFKGTFPGSKHWVGFYSNKRDVIW